MNEKATEETTTAKERFEKACRRFDDEALTIVSVLREMAHSIEELVNDNDYGMASHEISQLSEWVAEAVHRIDDKLAKVSEREQELER